MCIHIIFFFLCAEITKYPNVLKHCSVHYSSVVFSDDSHKKSRPICLENKIHTTLLSVNYVIEVLGKN